MTGGAELVEAIERVAAAADVPAATLEAERDKADAVLHGLAAERALSMVVPTEFGGLGLPVIAAARVVAAASAASGSAGLIAAMHLAQLVTLVRHGRGDRFEAFLRRQAEDQVLIASGTSETGVGGDILKSLCRTLPGDGGGYRLTKSCDNISYLDKAGAILATAMHEKGGRSVQCLVLLEAPGFDVRVDRESLLMGMRGIVNRAVTIEARFEASAVLPEPFTVIARTMSAASHLLWAAAWSGIAAAALDRAEAVAAETGAGPGAHRLSAAAERLYAMNALIRDGCEAFDAADPSAPAFQAASRSNGLKIRCADLLAEIVADCAAVAGFRGYAEGTRHSLSEIIRDSFSARIMISNDRLSNANAMVRRLVRERI
jgi:acyl-CoA dehydrogenase